MLSTHKSTMLKIASALIALAALFSAVSFSPVIDVNAQTPGTVRFAVIGDFGKAGRAELDVARLVKSWKPAFIITVGDNNYPDGKATTIDHNIGQYYHQYIYPYTGSYGPGAINNRFFPSLGNHDWHVSRAQPYMDYFTLPGNERYYDFTRGSVHLFAIDSDSHEPDGNSSTSAQALWLRGRLKRSTSRWNIVYMHHSPFSSGFHGSITNLQWPYAAWGADAVLSGHDHDYERIIRSKIPYIVNGLGGSTIYPFPPGTSVTGSRVRYAGDYGAMLVEANSSQMTFKFITRAGVLIDSHTIYP